MPRVEGGRARGGSTVTPPNGVAERATRRVFAWRLGDWLIAVTWSYRVRADGSRSAGASVTWQRRTVID